MPRVHGIDLVPRRGRRSSSSAAARSILFSGGGAAAASSSSVGGGFTKNDDIVGGSVVNNNVCNADVSAASMTSALSHSTVAAAEEFKRDNDNGDNCSADILRKVCGNTHEMTLNDDIPASSIDPHSLSEHDRIKHNVVTSNGEDRHYSSFESSPSVNHQSLLEENAATPMECESQATAVTSNKTVLKNTTQNIATNKNGNMICSNINDCSNNSSSVIMPQTKESIQHLQFSSHSFSVQSITKKKSSSVSNNNHQEHYDDNEDDYSHSLGCGAAGGGGGTALSSFGINHSLDTISEKVETNEKRKMSSPKQQQLLQQQLTLNPNARWLYNQCSIAKSKMEYPHSTLYLATKVLSAIRRHYSSSSSFSSNKNTQKIIGMNDNGEDSNAASDELEDDFHDNDDEQIQIIQHLLFKLLDEGKKRDLQFVFDVSSKSYELYEDSNNDEIGKRLTMDSLREIAVACGDNLDDDDSVDLMENDVEGGASTTSLQNDVTAQSDIDIDVERVEEKNVAIASTSTPTSSMRKIIRSRRKKRQSEEGGKRNDSDLSNIGNKSRDVGFNIQNDDEFNMQEEDYEWSFLSSAQNPAAEESNGDNNDDKEDGGPQSPIKVTRSVQQTLDFTVEEDNNRVEVQEDGESEELDLAVSAKNDDDDDFFGDNGNDALIRSGTLSFDHLCDTHCTEPKNDNDASYSRNITPRFHPVDSAAEENESDDESKLSQGESDLIDDVKLSSRKRTERREAVRIMFTGVTPTRRHMQMIETIGAEIVESIDQAHTVTHVIVTDGRAKLRRTPKLMICICKTSNVLSTEWLEQSANEQRVLDAAPFLWVGDKEAEAKYNFSMKETVQNGILARKRGGVLGGYYLYVCSGIAGNRAPSIKEFKLIIEAAGGHLLNSLAPSEVMDPLKTIVLTNDPPTPSQLKERGVTNIAKCGGEIETTSWLFHSIITQTNSIYKDDDTLESVSTPGSRVSHLEVAPPLSKRPQVASLPTPVHCTPYKSRDYLISTHETMSWMETLESSGDEAFVLTHGLWQNYFNEGNNNSSKTSRKMPSKPARRLRGRMHSVSPMVVTSVFSTNEKNLTSAKKDSTIDENPYITWEAIVLFTLSIRARSLPQQKSLVSETFVPASSYFSSPVAIQAKGKALALVVKASETDLGCYTDGFEIFGTLQDIFSLHQNQSLGMIPEQVVASFSLMAIEAVCAMHACGVAHNNLGMDSFLVVARTRKKNDWFLQMIGFGDKSVVLTCHKNGCNQDHYEHDFNCLANVIHQLLTGGVGITFTMNRNGSVELASKPFINGNLFLRGALSWCALMNALLCIGDVQNSRTSDQFRLDYPVDLLQVADEADAAKKRLYQFGWSTRILKELLSSQNDSLSTFLEELCTFNSRFLLPNVSLITFARIQSSDNQTFEFATQLKTAKENEDLRRLFAQKEAKLYADTLVMEEKESHHRVRGAQLKADLQNIERRHQSILKREREVQIREEQMIQNYSLREERLKRMKDDILQREQRLTERIRLFEEGKQYLQYEQEEEPVSYPKAKSPHDTSGGYKQNNDSIHKTPPPTNSNFQSSENDDMSERHRSRTKSNLEQLTPTSNTNDTMMMNNEVYLGRERNECLGMYGHANAEMMMTKQQQREPSQERMINSSQKRKRNRGKSPVPLQLDSLQSLPKSPKKQPPKKVFIGFEE